MDRSKSTNFERKSVNGKPNPKYVDLLEEDKAIAGQKFVCVSFVSPEKVLKQKEIFFFEEFLNKWELNKSMEKFVQFLNFASYKYNMSFDDLTNDFKDFVKDERDSLSKSNMSDEFKTFVDKNEEELEKSFNIANSFQTCTRGLKIRGSYPTVEEAELRCKMLRELDPNHDVFVGPVGMWMPWDPEAYKTGRVEYMEEELNQKSGNMLTQSIDEQGNLIGVNNTQEEDLKSSDKISVSDIRAELFEGDNIVVGKSDNGRSQLVSGPFAVDK